MQVLIKKITQTTKKSLRHLAGVVVATLYLVLPSGVMAAIRNPVIDPSLGGDGTTTTSAEDGTIFTFYFVLLWRAFINIGGIAVIIYFLWGAFEWITAGGDSSKLSSARNRMLQSAIGLIILVSSFTILGFISSLFFGGNFDLLQLTFPSVSTAPTTGSPTTP